MPETYDPLQWVNNTFPAINASNLNRVEQGIEALDDRAARLELGVTAPVVVPYATSITLNATQGALFRCVASGDLTLDDIVGGTDGQMLVLQVLASGAGRSLHFTGSTTSIGIPTGQWWSGTFQYLSAPHDTWLLVAGSGAAAGADGGNDLNVLAPQTLTYSGTVTPNAATGAFFRVTAPGDLILANPTNGTDGQAVVVEVLASGGNRTLTLANGAVSPIAIPSGAVVSVTLRYNAARSLWLVNGAVRGNGASAATPAWGSRLNVMDSPFNIVGDGTTDESAKLKAVEAAITDGTEVYFPPGCRVRFAQQSPAGGAALLISGKSNVGVTMAPGAELVMDNLSSGSGTSHGISVYGAGSNIRLDGCRVRWASAPSARSTGDGIRVLGYPSDSAPAAGWTSTTGAVSNVQVINATVVNAPQTGMIFMGASDVRVVNFHCHNTRADGLHFNACRRAVVAGHLARWDSAIGDDGLAFVTYQHATDVWQGTTGPFNQPTLGEWSNSGSSAAGVTVKGGLANGCRISGSLNVAVTGLAVTGKNNSGLVIDSAIANGTTINWSYFASRGITVANLAVQDCPIGVWVPTQNVDSSADPAYWTFDAAIDRATVRGATNYSVRTQGNGTTAGAVAGLQLTNLRALPAASTTGGRGAVSLSSLRDSRIDNITLITTSGAQLAVLGQDAVLTGALSTLPRHNVSVGDVVCVGGKVLFQDLNGLAVDRARSINSSTDGVQFIRCVNVDASTLGVQLANRGNTGTVRGVHFQKVRDAQVGHLTIEHDSNVTTSWRPLEVGGGDATDPAADNLRIAKAVYRNTRNQTGSDINVQTGTGAPVNLQYALAWWNGGEASPAWRTAFVDGPFAASTGGGGGTGMAPDFQTFTSSGTWTKPTGAAEVTVLMVGGGAGGGSGSRRASGTATSGGAGGGGGGWTTMTYPATTLGATETVTIGAGGAGGAAATTDDTNGVAGAAGGATTFGSRKAIASGGGAGSAGQNAVANAGGGGSSATAVGGNGGSGPIGAAGNAGGTGAMGAPGGGAGGGVSATPAAFAGGAGGGAPQTNLNGGAGGANSGTAGGAGTAGPTTLAVAGSAGGGGGANTGGAGGAGGAGAAYGAGGGGGGSVLNGAASGAGGAGAGGFAMVISVGAGGAGGNLEVQDEGTAVTQRSTLNFVGAGVSVADDSANSRTNVTISGTSVSTPWTYVAPGNSVQAAIDGGAKAIQLGAGNYAPFSLLGTATAHTRIQGVGIATVVIPSTSVNACITVGDGTDAGKTWGVGVSDLVCDANGVATHGIDWNIQATSQSSTGFYQGEPDSMCRMDNVWVYDALQVGLYQRGLDLQAMVTSRSRIRRSGTYGVWINNPDCWWHHNEATGGSTTGAAWRVEGANTFFSDNKAWFGDNYGFWLRATRCRVQNCEAQDNGNHGFFVDFAKVSLVGCMADQNGYNGGTDNTVDGFNVAGSTTTNPVTLVGCQSFNRMASSEVGQRYGYSIPTAMNTDGYFVANAGYGNKTALTQLR